MDLRGLSVVLVLLDVGSGCAMTPNRCEPGQADGFRCGGDVSDTADTLGPETDTGACLEGDDPVTLRLENRTGNAIEVVSFVRCDGTDPSEFPLMPPGLADGDDVEIPMPGPGCWLLDYAGEGCEGDMPHETAMDVCAGDTYVWTPDDLHHVCVG